jgi:MFS family permease
MVPIYPLYAIMFGEYGVDAFELSVLLSIWAGITIVTEVPSGALADRFSRKWLIVASGLVKSTAFITWLLWPQFWGFALGFVLWGAGSTLRSGAWEALLYDLLKAADKEFEFTRLYGRMAALSTTGVAVGNLAGGLLIVHGFDWVLAASAVVPTLAALPFAVLVKDAPRAARVREPGYLQTLQRGVIAAVNDRQVLYILLSFSFLIVTFGVYDEYIMPTLYEAGFSLSQVAFLCLPIGLGQALGHAMAGYFAKATTGQVLLLMALASATLPFYGIVSVNVIPVLMTAYFFTFGLASTLFQGHLQARISGDARATTTSTVSLGEGAGAILWFMMFGIMADASTMIGAALGMGLIVILLCGVFQWLAVRWQVS